MNQIDFLPQKYHEQSAQRRVQVWRLVVTAGFAMLIFGAAFGQHRVHQRLSDQSAAVVVQHEAVMEQSRQLTEHNARLQAEREEAELLTYLRHPWPRTRILAAVLGELPAGTSLDELQVARETRSSTAALGAFGERPRTTVVETAETLKNLAPAKRDLTRLRNDFDETDVIVTLTGVTEDTSVLYDYLGRMADSRLFSASEVRSIESVDGGRPGVAKFTARITVRSGYGQPSGPVPDEAAVAGPIAQSENR